MSIPSIITENEESLVASDRIKKAIAVFRKSFPDCVELAEISDSEIEVKVKEFTKNKQVVSPDLNTPSIQPLAIEEPIISCPISIAIVIVDCILMILRFTGIHVMNNNAIKEIAAKEIAKEVTKNLPEWKELIGSVKEADSLINKAKAIFNIGVAAHKAGMTGSILSSLKSSMKWWDWVIVGVAALAQIAALVLTDGAAFIAEIALDTAAVACVVSAAVKSHYSCTCSEQKLSKSTPTS